MPTASENDVPARRLIAQRILRPLRATIVDVVRWMGAVQAQDLAGSRWAVAARLPADHVTESDVEAALSTGAILRTHIFRGTWQLVAPEDVRWMVGLIGARVMTRTQRRFEQLGLDAAAFRRSRAVFEKCLRDKRQLTRDELSAALSRGGVDPAGERLSHLLGRAELETLICNGARRGNQSTWTLLDEWAPSRRSPKFDRDEAVAELARRYFMSRGPATLADFVWWSGLPVGEARAGMDAASSELVSENMQGRATLRGDHRKAKLPSPLVHLLPAFDEYLVAYRDRTAVVNPKWTKRLNAGGGMLAPTVLVDGRVAGLWRRVIDRTGVQIDVEIFERLEPAVREAIAEAARRYSAFLSRPLTQLSVV